MYFLKTKLIKVLITFIIVLILFTSAIPCLAAPEENISAKIVYISEKKKPYFVIDKGAKYGYKEWTRVCVFDDNNVKIFCSAIFLATYNKASVLMTENDKKILKPGMTVLPEDDKSAANALVDSKVKKSLEDEELKKKEVEKSSLINSMTKLATDSQENFIIEAGYLYAPLLNFQYNLVEYDAAAEASRKGEYFKKDQTRKNSLLGGYLAFNILTSPTTMFDLGLRYQYLKPSEISSDGDKNDLTSYVITDQKATSFGLQFDAFWKLYSWDNLGIWAGPGLASDWTTMKLTSTRKHDSGGDNEKFASAKSQADIFSFRLGSKAEYRIKPIVLGFGIGFSLPFFEIKTFSAKIDVSQGLDDLDQEKALEKLVNHKKSSFGAHLALYTGILF